MADYSLIQPFNLSYGEVAALANQHVDALVNQVKADLEGIKYTLSGDDSPLENCWDEICAQEQSQRFLIWEPYEMTIKGVIEGCFDALSHQDQLYINFAALQVATYIDDPSYECLYVAEIKQFLSRKVLQLALNDTNPRVDAYLDPSYEDDNEDNPYNPDEYVLLRIDSNKRADFLAALDLFSFVQHLEIDEQALPLLADLLDNLDNQTTNE
ncbi:hypothetical protein DYU11_09230 [Fibrisoma montanum]|uniref:Uncharacterized protein n=2 Tax=Fibrisoma montanum TaxID=2305895 RepID=A0A418MF80_9BACT|nr:hypothetical protein DYU11_09230 [Fibrisoma montanum]